MSRLLQAFFNDACFLNHQLPRRGIRSNKPTCERVYACPKCHRDLKITRGLRTLKHFANGKPHVCGKSFCTTCRMNVDKFNYYCFLRPLCLQEVQKKQTENRGVLCFFDMECLREDDGILTTNLVIVQDEFANEWRYEGLEAVEWFCEVLFDREGELYQATLAIHENATFYAHNGSRFDFLPFISRIQSFTGMDPEVVFDGSSLLRIKVFNGRLTFQDSWRFLLMRLECMPAAFGIDEAVKGFFPYLLNNRVVG